MSDESSPYSDGVEGIVPGWPTAAPVGVDSCPTPRTAPATRDEWVEVAMSFMWCHFARQVVQSQGPTEIHWAAVQYARDGLRKRLWDEIGSESDLDAFVGLTYASDYEFDWLATADGCAKARAIISIDDMNEYWAGDYGPRLELTDPAEQGGEVIGGQLWFRFVIGAARKGANPISKAVIVAGRGLSAHHVKTNVQQKCINRGRIDYSKWDSDGVSLCSWMAGKYSATTADNKEIDVEDYRGAWCQVRDDMKLRIAALETMNIKALTSACG